MKMNYKLWLVSIPPVVLTIVIILMGVFVWIPTAQDYRAIKNDEIAFFSSPVYCEIQKILCENSSALNLTELIGNSTAHIKSTTP